MTSSHQGCSQRGLALQPLLRQGFRTAIQVLLSLRHFGGCTSTNPVENVFAMKPPSSDTESLRDQQAAQICTTDGLFVAADKRRDLEGR